MANVISVYREVHHGDVNVNASDDVLCFINLSKNELLLTSSYTKSY